MPPRRSGDKTDKSTPTKYNTVQKGRITKSPKIHLRPKPRAINPELAEKISQMRLSIAPIVHVETGLPPRDFPSTMLSLFLLTEPQLDSMARYYNQSSPSALTFAYPAVMEWDKSFLSDDPSLPDECRLSGLERLKIKMRMFAQFIGMRGTEMPEWECERQMEILGKRVVWEVRRGEEEAVLRKCYRGPDMRF
jgi:hypothetical protein